jgi:tripartite-type tricarboxylate transporter receptor subunit TctC
MSRNRLLSVRVMLALGAALLLSVHIPAAAQQDYPSKPIRWVVAYTAGGAADLVTRVVAQELSTKLGQPIVVDNRPGATGRIGAETVARSPADGYTVMTGVISSHAIAPALSKTYPFDPLKDFTPIVKLGSSVQTLISRKTLPVRTVAELIDYAKKNPGKVNYGTTGPGSIGHIGGEMIRLAAGIDIIPVPYKGDSDAVKDVISGTLDIFLTPAARPSAEAGLVNVLGVASPRRATASPDWPTISESGLPGFTLVSWTGLMGPAGMPEPIVKLLNERTNEVLKTPAVQKRLEEIGYEVSGGTSQEFAADLRADLERFRKLNETLKIQMQ